MHPAIIHAVCQALTRLRRGVLVCCWVAGLALLAQSVIWALAMFTEIRWEEPAARADHAPTVVHRDSLQKTAIQSLRAKDSPLAAPVETTDIGAESDPSPARTASRADATLAMVFDHAATIGSLCLVALLPLLAVGVAIAAGGAVAGVDRAASGLTWAILVCALALPIGRWVAGTGYDGAFNTYNQMTQRVDLVRNAPADPPVSAVADGSADTAAANSPSTPVLYLRFLLLPMTCIVGLALVGLRFSAGVEGAILRNEYRIDPALEREAANIRASTLHGSGRAASALGAMTQPDPPAHPVSSHGSATTVSPGVAPRRII